MNKKRLKITELRMFKIDQLFSKQPVHCCGRHDNQPFTRKHLNPCVYAERLTLPVRLVMRCETSILTAGSSRQTIHSPLLAFYSGRTLRHTGCTYSTCLTNLLPRANPSSTATTHAWISPLFYGEKWTRRGSNHAVRQVLHHRGEWTAWAVFRSKST